MEPPSTLPVDDVLRDEFLKWCQSQLHVTLSDGIDLFHAFREGYRGVMATRDLEADAELVRISCKCCIGPATTDSSALEWTAAVEGEWLRAPPNSDPARANAGPGLTKACVTVLRILHELGRGPNSSSAPYLAMLPMDHRIPIEWSAQELALLDGTAAEPLVNMGSLDSQYRVFEEIVERHPNLWHKSVRTKKAFAKAVNWVRSRGFTLFGDAVMIPCADMFNHDPTQQNVQFCSESDGDYYVMRTLRPIKAGEELFSSFGHLSNASLVNSYGFVLRNNAFDNVILPVKVLLDVAHKVVESEKQVVSPQSWEERVELLGELIPAPFIIISKYDLVPGNLLEGIQLLLMTDDELLTYTTVLAACEVCLERHSAALSKCKADAKAGIKGDAAALAKALITEEIKIFRDLKGQLRAECLDGDDDGDEADGASEADEVKAQDGESLEAPAKKQKS